MANQKKHRWLPYLMVLPAFSIMVLVVVFPIVNTVARSFRTADGQFTLDNYAYFFTSAEALQSLLFTLAAALIIMAAKGMQNHRFERMMPFRSYSRPGL